MKRERVPQIRSWKKSFDKGFDVENPSYPQRENITMNQKNYLRRAWSWASVALLGMDRACIPNCVPCYNEKKGWHFVAAIDPEWNHIDGVGESMRLEGRNDYNRPENLVPLSKINHTQGGFMVGEDGEEVEIFVVHQDSAEARKAYGKWKNGGMIGKDPYKAIHDSRAQFTDSGHSYHNTDYDEFFRDLARRVISAYVFAMPHDKWPK